MSTNTPDQRTYDDVLADAVRVLTEAARLRRPVLQRVETSGQSQTPAAGEWVESGRTEPADWPEFVTLALAGAAANAGGIETALAGRPGSWEASGVRGLLESTVGADEADLWRHRTEPLQITLYVDEILVDAGNTVVQEYGDALDELHRRADAAATAEEAALDDTRYVWWYDRDDAGDFIARDPDAPAWSWDAWRDQPSRDPELSEWRDHNGRTTEDALRAGVNHLGDAGQTHTYIAKSPEAAAELWRLEDAGDARVQAIAELEDRLEAQRIAEWRAYGEALKANILSSLLDHAPGLAVPLDIVVDVDTYRPDRELGDFNALETRLVDHALMDTTTPADLPGTPLDRLGIGPAQPE